MDPYTAPHFGAIAVFVLGVPVVAWLGARERRTGVPTASRTLAVLIPVVFLPTQVVDLTTNFDIDVSLPLHLCDLGWIAATVALWTKNRYAVALTYFWSILTFQAILTPALGEPYPELRFFAYWALHLLIVWAAIFLVAGLRLTPTWSDYGVTVAVTLTWAALTYVFNVVADTNYGYLREKPGGSVLELLGPWPVYVFAEIAIVATVWALMTWPWVRRHARPGQPAEPVGVSAR